MQKYRLYKYPVPVTFEDEYGRVADARFIDPPEGGVKGELIAVVEGDDIIDAAAELCKEAKDDLDVTYNCAVTVDAPGEDDTLQNLTGEHFDYQITSYVHIPNQPVNTIILFGIRVAGRD